LKLPLHDIEQVIHQPDSLNKQVGSFETIKLALFNLQSLGVCQRHTSGTGFIWDDSLYALVQPSSGGIGRTGDRCIKCSFSANCYAPTAYTYQYSPGNTNYSSTTVW
jgi:hypothetical protein